MGVIYIPLSVYWFTQQYSIRGGLDIVSAVLVFLCGVAMQIDFRTRTVASQIGVLSCYVVSCMSLIAFIVYDIIQTHHALFVEIIIVVPIFFVMYRRFSMGLDIMRRLKAHEDPWADQSFQVPTQSPIAVHGSPAPIPVHVIPAYTNAHAPLYVAPSTSENAHSSPYLQDAGNSRTPVLAKAVV